MDLLGGESIAASYARCAFLFLGACVPSALAVVSTPKSGINSFVRYALPAVVVSNGKQLLQAVSEVGTSYVVNGVIIGLATLVFIQCCNFLIISRLDADDLIKANVFAPSDNYFTKVLRTASLICNLRGVGTPWETRRREFPRFYTKDGDSKPSWGWYIVRQLMIISWQYLFLDIVYMSSFESTPEDIDKLFGQGKEFMYLNATAEQWGSRVAVALIPGLGPARVMLDIMYRSVSVLSVLFGFTSPEEWPPLFGCISDNYTIRRVWSVFWHQYPRWTLTTISNFISRDLLRLPRPSRLERYVNIAAVFLLSGVYHVALDVFTYQPPTYTPTVAFFCSSAVAILIEDAVQKLYSWAFASESCKPGQGTPWWQKLVGYVWVVSFLTLTAPWYLYHPIRLAPETKWLVPFGVVHLMGPPVAHGLLVAGGVILKFTICGEV